MSQLPTYDVTGPQMNSSNTFAKDHVDSRHFPLHTRIFFLNRQGRGKCSHPWETIKITSSVFKFGKLRAERVNKWCSAPQPWTQLVRNPVQRVEKTLIFKVWVSRVVPDYSISGRVIPDHYGKKVKRNLGKIAKNAGNLRPTPLSNGRSGYGPR